MANQKYNIGMEKGIIKGAYQNKIEIAKKMIKEKMNIDFISEIIGLSKQEITALR